ncbi:MAG TPA: hypothetical protein VGB56_11545 [Flavisolibacter sp.]
MGAYSAFYPYPFVNVAEIGSAKTLINSFLLMLFLYWLPVVLLLWAKACPALPRIKNEDRISAAPFNIDDKKKAALPGSLQECMIH